MRRLLGICVLAAGILAVFGVGHREPTSAFAAGQEAASAGPATNAILIAKGLAARAVALDPHAAVDLTDATAADRVFAAISSNTATSLVPIAGSGEAGSRGDGGAATAAQLNLAPDSLIERSGIAVVSDGTVFIADSENSTVRSVAGPSSSEPGIIRSVAGRWAPPQNVTLSEPMGLAVDRAGNLYIADHAAGAVDELVAATGQLETLAQVVSPASVAVTLDGTKVFVASPETGGVFAIATISHAINAVAGLAPASPSSGSRSSNVCPSIENGALLAPKSQGTCPAGLAVDGRGNLFVADANAGKILRVDAVTSKVTTAAASLSSPGDIAFDSKGDLFVSEQGRTRVIELAQLGDPAGALSLLVPGLFPTPCPQVSDPFTFCNVPTGGSSQIAAFTLTNTSSSAVSQVTIGFIPAATPGNFSVQSTACTSNLSAGQSCLINVAFTPQTTGSLAGSLSVTDSNPADTVTASLAGMGDDYSLQLASSQQLEVTVAQGSTATFNGQIVPVGAFGEEGESVQLVCPKTLPSNTSCVISPCTASITAGTPTAFAMTLVTSSTTSVAPVPAPQSTGCTSYGPQPTSRILPRSPSRGPGDGGRFPPLLCLTIFAALSLFLGWLRATKAAAARPRASMILAFAGIAAAILVGCHHGNSNLIGPATTVGTTTMIVTSKAVDAHGNSLNAARAMPQVMLDVVPTPSQFP